MMKQIFLVLFLTLVVVNAKHIHPRSIVQIHDREIPTEIDGIPIDVIRNIRPTRFVPINNVLFFNTYPPCEEGFERDLVGVCREVWE